MLRRPSRTAFNWPRLTSRSTVLILMLPSSAAASSRENSFGRTGGGTLFCMMFMVSERPVGFSPVQRYALGRRSRKRFLRRDGHFLVGVRLFLGSNDSSAQIAFKSVFIVVGDLLVSPASQSVIPGASIGTFASLQSF
jgi:hypothetical protein